MSLNFKPSVLPFAGALLCLLAPLSSQAATILHNCFNAPQDYSVQYDREITATENQQGNNLDVPEHLTGTGAELEANCSCPGNLYGDTAVSEVSFAGSPMTGTGGYAPLTDKLDIDVQGYSDAVNSTSGEGLFELVIDKYPTPRSDMAKNLENTKPTEGTADVCSTSSRPADATDVKRKFKWNVIGVLFHIKKPILGIESFPATLVVQNYACLYFGSGTCDVSNAELVSNIWLSGSLSAPLSCTINEGSTIEVEFGSLVSKQFRSKGRIPEGYTLKNVDITYHCDANAVGNTDRIKLTLSADQGVVENSEAYIAKMLNKEDIGVRIMSETNQNIALDGSYDFPVTMDEQGNGAVRIKAAPVSTSDTTPEPGKFEGNVTVKMDLR